MGRDVLALARGGDERAFAALTEPYRRELWVHCYRMLGSLADADDLLQETLLAAWRGLPGFEGRASVRTWLYRIATNRCLNAVRATARRPPPAPTPPFDPPEPTRRAEVTWVQPCPDTLLAGVAETAPGPEARYQSAEAVELAFVVALQRLPPRQTAVLVLRDVLGFPADEVADLLDTTPTAVKGALQRARAALAADQRPPRADPAGERELGRRFAAAYTAADVEGLVALLTDDAWLAMPPARHEYQGRTAIAAFLAASFAYRPDRHLVATRANGHPAFGSYVREPGAPTATPGGLIVLRTAGDRVHTVTRFHVDALYPRFGLPTELR